MKRLPRRVDEIALELSNTQTSHQPEFRIPDLEQSPSSRGLAMHQTLNILLRRFCVVL